MNKDKVYLEGYVVGHAADTLGYKGLLVQLGNSEIVEIDKNLVHQGINEPQKVVVSEKEAKFLETFDFNCENDVTTALYYVSRTGWGYYLRDNDGIDLKDLSEGLRELENRKRLIKAILDGYTVEEKRYLVKIKGIEENINCLNYDYSESEWYLADDVSNSSVRTHHTRKELEEAGFGEVFNSPLFKVEEVEG